MGIKRIGRQKEPLKEPEETSKVKYPKEKSEDDSSLNLACLANVALLKDTCAEQPAKLHAIYSMAGLLPGSLGTQIGTSGVTCWRD